MTILGLHVIDRERALFWCDSEIFSAGEPSGAHHCKMAINPMAQTVAAGAGWADLAGEGCRAVLAAGSFDEATDTLPDVLRKAAVRLEPRHRDRRHNPFAANVFLIAGWSHRDNRMMGYSFDAFDFFAPTVTTAYGAPWADRDGFRPIWPADVLPLARAQMARLRDTHRGATGGHLCVADLRPDWLAAIPFHNFAAGCAIDPAVETAATRGAGGEAAPDSGAPALRVVA